MKRIILLLAIGIVAGAPVTPDPSLCQVCHLLLGQVQTHVKQGRTQATLLDYEATICNDLPTDEKDACKQFIGENSNTFFQKLISDLSPSTFCDSLDVCAVIPVEEPAILEQNDEPENVEGIVECELCKLVILGVDKLLGSNRSAAAVNDTLEKFCSSLPEKIAKTCHEIEPLIIKVIEDGVDPAVACKVATLCAVPESNSDISMIPCDVCYTSLAAIGLQDPEPICSELKTCMREAEMVVAEKPVEIQDEFECQLCKFVVAAADGLIGENRSAAAVNSTLMDLCNDLPGELKDACLKVEPDIVKAVIGGIDPTLACEFIKACQKTIHVPVSSDFIPCHVCKETLEAVAGERGVQICHTMPKVCGPAEPKPEPEQITTPVCPVCQFVTKSIADLLQTDQSRDAISATMEHVCDQLPETEQSFCTTHGDHLLDYMVEGGRDPVKGCIALSVCEELEEIPPMVEEIPPMVEKVPPMIAPIVKEPVEQVLSPEQPKASPECDLCKFIVTFVDQFLDDNATHEQINQTLFEVCDLLPEEFRETCDSVIPQAEKILENGFEPNTTCQAIGLCATGYDAVPRMSSCDLCDEILDQRHSTEEMANACHAICPRSQKPIMKEPVEQVLLPAKPKATPECDLCKFVVTFLDQFLDDNVTLEKLNATLFEVCGLLPEAFQETCFSLVPQAEKILENGFKPDETCAAVGLCTNAEYGAVPRMFSCDLCDDILNQKDSTEEMTEACHAICPRRQKRSVKQVVSSVVAQMERTVKDKADYIDLGSDGECEFCELLIKTIDVMIGEDKTDEKINATIVTLCTDLAGQQLVQICLQEAPKIVDLMKKGLNPHDTCVVVALCQPAQNEHKLEKRSLKEMTKKTVSNNLKDAKCDVCEFLIDEVDNLIGQNASHDKINTTVYGLCERIPGGTVKELCYEIAPTIVGALANGVDPKTACTALKLCTALEININKKINEQVEDKANAGDSIECEICKFVIKEIDQIVTKNSSAAQINATVFGVCDRLPKTVQDMCYKNAPKVVQAIEQGVDADKICEEIKLCTAADVTFISKAKKQYEDKANVGDSIECEICKFVIKEIDQIVTKNSSAAQINATVFGVCDRLPKTVQDMCYENAPKVVQAIEQGVDADKICEEIKLCTAAEITMNTKVEEQVEDQTKLGDTIECEICKFVIKEIDQIVTKNSSAAQINATVFGVCDRLPKTVQAMCYENAPKVVQAIEQGVDADKICEEIKLCTAADTQTRQGDSIECEICKFVIKEIDQIVTKNSSAAQINATVFGVCDRLPKTVQDMCYKNAPKVVQAIEQGVDPDTVCTEIKLCTAAEITIQAKEQVEDNANLGDTIECEICKFVIKEIDQIVEKNSSAAQINATVFGVCDKLPKTVQSLCYKNAPTVVQAIERGVDAKNICTDIRLCTAAGTETDMKIKAGKKLDCSTCRRALKPLHDDWSDIYEKVRRTMLKLCNSLPNEFQTKCTTTVSNDNGVFYKLFLQSYTPSLLCEMAQCVENNVSDTKGKNRT